MCGKQPYQICGFWLQDIFSCHQPKIDNSQITLTKKCLISSKYIYNFQVLNFGIFYHFHYSAFCIKLTGLQLAFFRLRILKNYKLYDHCRRKVFSISCRKTTNFNCFLSYRTLVYICIRLFIRFYLISDFNIHFNNEDKALEM